jgi:hypothetical protein
MNVDLAQPRYHWLGCTMIYCREHVGRSTPAATCSKHYTLHVLSPFAEICELYAGRPDCIVYHDGEVWNVRKNQ